MRPLDRRQRRCLARVGLRLRDFDCFITHFVGHRFDYIQRRRTDKGWWLVRGWPLTNAMLLRHLKGERWIGTGSRWDPTLGTKGRHVTSYVVLDLDYHGDRSEVLRQLANRGYVNDPAWRVVLKRYDLVSRALGTPSLVLVSSDGGGLHCYYLLTHPVELHRLRELEATDGAVVRLLAAYGLPESAGVVEVYPRGQYKRRGPQNRLRLPFGRGSVALDPFTLDRLTLGDHRADLRCVTDRLKRGLIPVVDPDYWIEEARSLAAPVPKVRPRSSGKRVKTSNISEVAEGPEPRKLWSLGLSGNGQFTPGGRRCGGQAVLQVEWKWLLGRAAGAFGVGGSAVDRSHTAR
jgi:hypothetical protein